MLAVEHHIRLEGRARIAAEALHGAQARLRGQEGVRAVHQADLAAAALIKCHQRVIGAALQVGYHAVAQRRGRIDAHRHQRDARGQAVGQQMSVQKAAQQEHAVHLALAQELGQLRRAGGGAGQKVLDDHAVFAVGQAVNQPLHDVERKQTHRLRIIVAGGALLIGKDDDAQALGGAPAEIAGVAVGHIAGILNDGQHLFARFGLDQGTVVEHQRHRAAGNACDGGDFADGDHVRTASLEILDRSKLPENKIPLYRERITIELLPV